MTADSRDSSQRAKRDWRNRLRAIESIQGWLSKFKFTSGFVLCLTTAVFALEKLKQSTSVMAELKNPATSLGWLFQGYVQYAPVLAFGLLILTVYLATTYVDLLLDREQRRAKTEAKRQQSILFIAPKLEGFYAEYMTALVHAARREANTSGELVITPYVASADNQVDFHPEIELADIVERMPDQPAGVFLIPSAPKHNKAAILDFCTKHDKIHLVTLDVYPCETEEHEYPHFVGGNEVRGGQLAAMRAIAEIRSLLSSSDVPIAEIRVLILIGATTSWEEQRPFGFEQELTRAQASGELGPTPPQVRVTRSRPLNYELGPASKYLLNWRESLDASGNVLEDPFSYHVIFACNDEMALGAARALRMLSQGRCAVLPKVIGYDGTSRMKTVLELGHDSIAHTVCVDLNKQATEAVAMMRQLIRKRPTDRKFHQVVPKGWPQNA